MECPHCHWKRIEIAEQNWISVLPVGDQSFVHQKLLDAFIKVYRCQMPGCGFCWPVNDGQIEMRKF